MQVVCSLENCKKIQRRSESNRSLIQLHITALNSDDNVIKSSTLVSMTTVPDLLMPTNLLYRRHNHAFYLQTVLNSKIKSVTFSLFYQSIDITLMTVTVI